jgi:hypothetical protein
MPFEVKTVYLLGGLLIFGYLWIKWELFMCHFLPDSPQMQ